MKGFFAAALIFCCTLFAVAQETAVNDTTKSDTAEILLLRTAGYRHLLYNYTSVSLNNVFNEGFRPNAGNRVNIDFDYAANSNVAPMQMVYALVFKGPISNKLKDRADSRIKNNIKFEDYMNTGATYRHHFKKWDGTVILGWHHRQSRIVFAPKQAFELAFYGNARFEGDTVSLTNINVQNHIYNALTLGISKTIDYGTYQMEFGVAGSFLHGVNNQMINTGESWVYTAPDADSIVFNYDLTLNSARDGFVEFKQLNGAGASGDFHLAFSNNDKWKISLDLMDVGYMTYRKAPLNYSAVKTATFKGVVIPDLVNFSSQTFDTLNLDSTLRTNLPSKSNNKYSVFMPFSAQLVFSKPLMNNRLVLNVGLLYRYMPQYYVYGYAKVNYFIKPDMVFSASAGAGGYSLFNLGVDFSKSWKYFDFTIGTNNLLGLVAPTHMPGASVYLRLASSF